MTTLETVLLILLVLDALALAGLILIQHGKGADIGAAFGAGAANTMFGGRGSASFLVKATSWLAVGFFVISFGLAYTAKERAAGVRMQGLPAPVAGIPAPAPTAVDETQTKESAAPAESLTHPKEPVDSDIPDV